MSIHQNLLSTPYVPAILRHNATGWLIEYYVRHPKTQLLTRQRVKLNLLRKRYATNTLFRIAATDMVNTLNIKLAGGWNPYWETDDSRYYTKLEDVVNIYLAEKVRELRPDTYRTYKSWCSMFLAWCDKNCKDVYASMVNRLIAVKYMDYMYTDRKISPRAYNNNVKQGRAFFSWCLQKCYVKANPFEQIKLKREQEKKRILIPENYRQRITDYLQEHDPGFLIVCMLVFGSLIRPKEIRSIRIKDVHPEKHYIYIPADKAKNHHERCAAINDKVCAMIAGMLKTWHPDSWYLIGKGYRPSAAACPEARMRKDWDKLRDALKLPAEMQLYSLRDTGINNMLKSGIDPLTVMQHADHHDLSMTTRYANHADEHLIDTIVRDAPDF